MVRGYADGRSCAASHRRSTTCFRRKEWKYMTGDVAYLGAFAFLAWGRFALVPF